MFQFRRFPSYTYFIQYMIAEVCSAGLLHSEICGSMCTYHSPQLIAVNHVLRRLPMPRHSPCALYSFTILLHVLEFSWVIVNYSQIPLIVVFYPIKFYLIVFLLTRSILICITFALFSFQVSGFLFLRTDFSSKFLCCSNLFLVVGTNGLEPSTSRLSGVRSNHLSYAPISLVEMRRIELLTLCVQGRCSPSWATPPFFLVKVLFTASSKLNNA